MTEPALSRTALAQMLRALADQVGAVESNDAYEVSMESEEIGHATKTTITLWALKRPTQNTVELAARRVTPWRVLADEVVSAGPSWCSTWRADIAPSRRCQTFLRADGSCPNAERHR